MLFLFDGVNRTTMQFNTIEELLKYLANRISYIPTVTKKEVAMVFDLFACNENDTILLQQSLDLEQMLRIKRTVEMKTLNIFGRDYSVPVNLFVKRRFLLKDDAGRIISASQLKEELESVTLDRPKTFNSNLGFKFRQTPVPHTKSRKYRKIKCCAGTRELATLKQTQVDYDEFEEEYCVPIRRKRVQTLSFINDVFSRKSIEPSSWKSHCKKQKAWMKNVSSKEVSGRQATLSKPLQRLFVDTYSTDYSDEDYFIDD